MIVLLHHKNQFESCQFINGDTAVDLKGHNHLDNLKEISAKYGNEWLVWCERDAYSSLDFNLILSRCKHSRIMLCHNTGNNQFFGPALGYVEETPFVTVQPVVCYPTWQMNSIAGAIHTSCLGRLVGCLQEGKSFPFLLNEISKNGQQAGLLCYQVLLLKQVNTDVERASLKQLFRFVARYYGIKKVSLLSFCLFRYERKFPLISFLSALLVKKAEIVTLDEIVVNSNSSSAFELDVIIPTMGRAEYLYDVLKDFAAQTILPNKIIIIEQNPQEDSTTALEYIKTKQWPFSIDHKFIHQTGVCNARNLAIAQTSSEWVFFADDDNRFPPDLLKKTWNYIEKLDADVITTSYLQQGEKKNFTLLKQWAVFGAGNSFVKGDIARSIRFDEALEFGYGEDIAYGYELRKRGHDILYVPQLEILHLKAPIGGFRTTPTFLWDNEKVQPKPSPTQMVVYLNYRTIENLKSYKLMLFSKFYKNQSIKNPFTYLRDMSKRWDSSIYWAKELIQRNSEN